MEIAIYLKGGQDAPASILGPLLLCLSLLLLSQRQRDTAILEWMENVL